MNHIVLCLLFSWTPATPAPFLFPTSHETLITVNNLRSLLKSTVFLPISYAAIMRENEMTQKVQNKNPQNCWEIVHDKFSHLVNALLNGKL